MEENAENGEGKQRKHHQGRRRIRNTQKITPVVIKISAFLVEIKIKALVFFRLLCKTK